MQRRLIPGLEVEHAGQRWHVHRLLGPDAVLLRDSGGALVSVEPHRLCVPCDKQPARPTMIDRHSCSDNDWAEAARRRDLLEALAALPARTRADVTRAG